MGERFQTRALTVSRAFTMRSVRTEPPRDVNRILVAHDLLLGDTLMLTALLAKLRHVYPHSQMAMLASPAAVPLYSTHPYGVRALPFRRADATTAGALLGEAPFDRAYVVGDNRYSWLAAAMGSAHIVAHAGDRPWTKDWFVDAKRAYPNAPAAWSDTVADLAEGPDAPPYRRSDWPSPPHRPFALPPAPYAVLHVGASTPLKRWPAARWRELADALAARGCTIAWSAGAREASIVDEIGPQPSERVYAGSLDLPQLWRLIEGARLLVAPDTGIAHLGRVVGTPTVAIFGPGSTVICGNGRFWRDMPWRAVTREDFPCRDQRVLFRRELEWVRRCGRSTAECERPLCMEAVATDDVLDAVEKLSIAV